MPQDGNLHCQDRRHLSFDLRASMLTFILFYRPRMVRILLTAFLCSSLNLPELPDHNLLSSYPTVKWYLTEGKESSKTPRLWQLSTFRLYYVFRHYMVILRYFYLLKKTEKIMQNVNSKCLVTPFLWAIGAATTGQVASPHLCTPAQLLLEHPLSLWGFSGRWSSANTIVPLRYSKTAFLLIKALPYSDMWKVKA
jgi:hypothetical protein